MCKPRDGEKISQQQPEQGTTRSTDIISTVSMPMRTGANNTPLGPPQQEERMKEEEVMTDFFQILQPTRIFPT
jgi:hypothetical protein